MGVYFYVIQEILRHTNIFSLLAITGCLYAIVQVKHDFIMQPIIKKTLYIAAIIIIIMALIDNYTYVVYGFNGTEEIIEIYYTVIYFLMGIFPYIFLVLLDKKIFYEGKVVKLGMVAAIYTTTLLLNLQYPILFSVEPETGFEVCQFYWLRPTLLSYTYLVAFADIFKSMYKISKSEISTINYTIGLFVIGVLYYDICYSGEIIPMLLSLGLTYIVSVFHRLELKTDSITSLPNRFVYINDSERYYKEDMVVGSIDLNDLKKVNDSLGHEEGDAYIRANALTIADALKPYGTLYRTGGDEFIFLGKNLKAVNRVLMNLQERQFCFCKHGTYKLSFSYGVTMKEQSQTVYDAGKIADKLMYENKVKIKGINNVR